MLNACMTHEAPLKKKAFHFNYIVQKGKNESFVKLLD